MWKKKKHPGWNGADLKLNPEKTLFIFFLNLSQPDLSFLYKTAAGITIYIWTYMADPLTLGGRWEPISDVTMAVIQNEYRPRTSSNGT